MNEYNFTNKYNFINKLYGYPIPFIKKVTVLLSRLIIEKPKRTCIIKTIYDFKMVVDPINDSSVQRDLYYWGVYEYGTLEYLKEHVQTSSVIYDIGANIGMYSLFFSKFSHKQTKIISFEPNPETSKLLAENIKLNSFNNIEIVELGVGDKNHTISFFSKKNLGESSFVESDNYEKKINLTVVKLDDWIEETQNPIPNLIKIDIEGLEYEALIGARKTIKNCKKLVLIVECNNTSKEELNKNKILLDLLQNEFGMKVYYGKYGKRVKSKLMEVRTYHDLPSYDNLICLKG